MLEKCIKPVGERRQVPKQDLSEPLKALRKGIFLRSRALLMATKNGCSPHIGSRTGIEAPRKHVHTLERALTSGSSDRHQAEESLVARAGW